MGEEGGPAGGGGSGGGGGWGRGRGQRTFHPPCHTLHYHMVLRPEGTSHNNTTLCAGYVVDLLDAITRHLCVSYEIVLNADGKIGKEDGDAWTGVIGDVKDGVSTGARGRGRAPRRVGAPGPGAEAARPAGWGVPGSGVRVRPPLGEHQRLDRDETGCSVIENKSTRRRFSAPPFSSTLHVTRRRVSAPPFTYHVDVLQPHPSCSTSTCCSPTVHIARRRVAAPPFTYHVDVLQPHPSCSTSTCCSPTLHIARRCLAAPPFT